MSLIGAKANPLPDRILTSEVVLGKRFAHHNCARRACPVAFVKQAAAVERNAHGCEVVRAHRVSHSGGVIFGVSLEFHAIYLKITAQRQLTGERTRHDTGKLTHRFKGLGEKNGASAIGVEFVTGLLHLHGQQMGCIETRINREQTIKAVQ